MATVTCPRCGARLPGGSVACPRCGADLAASPRAGQHGDRRRQSHRPRWLIGGLVLVAVAAVALAALLRLPGQARQGAPAAAWTATPAPTATALSREDGAPAGATPAPSDTPPPPTDTPAPLAQQQADFRVFAGQILGSYALCHAAGTVAERSFQAAVGHGAVSQALKDVQKAMDACDAAQSAVATLAVPASLAHQHLGDVTINMSIWALGESSLWNDEQKLLRDPGDSASAADAKQMRAQMPAYYLTSAAKLTVASVPLKVPMASITPIAPP